MAQWTVSNLEFLFRRIKPGVCECTERTLSYPVPGPMVLEQLPPPRVGLFRLLLGQVFPTILPNIPEPKIVWGKRYQHRVIKTKCNWCKYLKAMGVTHVCVIHNHCKRTTTIIREN